MEKKMTNDKSLSKLLWICISLVCALFIWAYVISTEVATDTDSFDGIPVVYSGEEELREAKGYILTDKSVNNISVVIQAPRRVLTQLKSQQDGIQAIVDLKIVTGTGQYTPTYSLRYPSGIDTTDISIKSRSDSTVSFYVDEDKSVPVEVRWLLSGSVADGYVADRVTLNPSTVTISGAASEVNQVSHALVEFTRTDIDATIDTEVSYVLIDHDDNVIDEAQSNIKRSTESVNVLLPIKASKTVPLRVDVIPSGGATEKNLVIEYDTATIDIAGDAETLKGINSIVLGTIELSSFMSTTERTYTIPMPEGVENLSKIAETRVTFKITGLESTLLTISNFETKNVTEGYTATVSTLSLDVRVRGSAESIARIEPSNFRIVLDLADAKTLAGRTTVTAKIYVDGFTDVDVVGEYTAIVILSEDTDEGK